MNVWILALLALNLIMGLAVAIIFIRLTRSPKDDPRLSRGLQLLQSKIAVLEDLSDRTEVQVSQLSGLMQQKILDVQKASQEAELQIERIKASMEKSKEVARLFQDKIPHQEIIERQNTAKYMRATQLAQEGHSIVDIAQSLDLPVVEVELLTKLGRDRAPDLAVEEPDAVLRTEEPDAKPVPAMTTSMAASMTTATEFFSEATPSPSAPVPGPTIRRVQFPRIEMTRNLS